MTRIISLQNANRPLRTFPNNRILSLDLAKGFTVLFIPAIHVAMLYSSLPVHKSVLGSILRFIAEWPGAQLLMFVMGMSLSFSKKSLKQQLLRASVIFFGGYLLNIFKFLFLYWLKLLPVSFVNELHFLHSRSAGLNFFLIGDILQFAGLALAVMSLLNQSKYYPVFAVFIAYLVIVASPLAWDWHHSNFIIDHLLHLVGGSTPECFFPFVPWIIYPLAGLAIGSYLQWPYSSFKAIFFSGLFSLVSGYAMQLLPYRFPDSLFWRTYPDKTIMHLGFVMIWICGWFSIVGLPKKRLLRQCLAMTEHVLCFCSRNITVIYLVQWILIFWMFPLWGYHQLDIGETLIAMSFVYAVVFGICYLFKKPVNRD